MSTKKLAVARGCIKLGSDRFNQGDLIELSEEDAVRYLATGIVCEIEDAPGYKKTPGMAWVRLKTNIHSVNEGESGVAGDIRHVSESNAMNWIEYKLAEAYEVPSHV